MRIRVARALGRRWGDVRYALARGERRRAAAAVAAAHPDLDPPARRRLLRESFRHRGAAAWEEREARRLDLVDLCRLLTLDGWEFLQQAEAAGCGVLLVTAAGGYPGIAARAVGAYSSPLHVAAGGDDLATLEQVLLGNGKVMIELDQPSDRAARLALATGAPAVSVFASAASRGKYRLAFAPAVWPSEVAGQPPERSVVALSRRFLEVAAGPSSDRDRKGER